LGGYVQGGSKQEREHSECLIMRGLKSVTCTPEDSR
jgi:hypothetical protein